MTRMAQLLIGAFTDFVLTLVATLTGYMMGQGGVVMPTGPMWLLAGLLSAGAAAKHLRAMTLDLKPLVVLLALGFALTGCATTASGPAARHADHVAALRAFTVADLEGAVRLAVEGQDDAAMLCYQFVLTEVKKAQMYTPGSLGADTPGPISVIQKFRNGIHGPTASTSRTFFGRLDLHCASFRTSVEIDIIRGVAMGAAVAGGDVAAILPALKALAPLLGLNLP